MSPARGPRRSGEPQTLGEVLDALGAERRLASGLLLGRLGRQWGAVVGERLAEESAPAALEGGALLVKTSSAAWAAQIKFLAKEITEQANRVLGEAPEPPIRQVRVVVEPGSPAR